MSLKIALQMDPIEGININTDSTFSLALEAQKRGYWLYHYLPRDLTFHNGAVTASARRITVKREHGRHFQAEETETIDLATFDIILMRQDPPFDMAYITATHILEHISSQSCVFNDPFEVRNAPEKLFVTRFPDLMPPTLITSDSREILEFRKEHSEIIVKPLFGNGGASVFHITPDNDNLNALLEMFTQLFREPVIVQKYLPAIRQGDKRIILVDGKPAGALNRIPAAGEARANLHIGGHGEKATLTDRDIEICEAIGPELARRNLIFTGIDVIGGFLTEINVTSPTCIQEINHFNGCHIEADLWDVFEERYRQHLRQKATTT